MTNDPPTAYTEAGAGAPGRSDATARPAVDEAHRAVIAQRLQTLEAAEGVSILLAVESGSRAWGFASPDSDYDVRFVYVRPLAHYLSVRVEDRRDVIEQPIVDEIDLNGWDLRKALRLLARSNPTIVEWLQSPITYVERGPFRAHAIGLLPTLYSGRRGLHHYRHMAANNCRAHLRGERVRLKKYLYSLRPLLAARWIEARGTPPPIEFSALLAAADLTHGFREAVAELIARKRAATELADGPPLPALQEFIETELRRTDTTTPAPDGIDADTAWTALDQLFVQVLHARQT
jgi:uncharacterized protein